MENEDTFEAVRECLGFALNLDDAETKKITRETRAVDHKKWDSMGHLRLIIGLEERFEIQFDDQEFIGLVSVDLIINTLRKKI